MPDFTLTTKQALALYPVLIGIGPLTPPPTPKGRYVLGKATTGITGPASAAEKEGMDRARLVATRDDQDQPILKVTPRGVTFDVQPSLRDEYAKDVAEWEAKPVVLTGVRQITRAELGECPITVEMELVLVECGLLEDTEPV